MTVYLHHFLHKCSPDTLDLLLSSFHLSSHLLITETLRHGLFMCPFVSHVYLFLVHPKEQPPIVLKVTLLTALRGPHQSTQLL